MIYVGQQLGIPQGTPPPPPPPPTPAGSLSNEPNHQFSLNETWPFIKKYSQHNGGGLESGDAINIKTANGM